MAVSSPRLVPRPFRVLSIDGGGIRGIIPAAVLQRLEERVGPLRQHYDLIVGTSTGGLLAIGLGAEMSARRLVQIYLTEAPRIFTSPWYYRARTLFGAKGPKYDGRGLREVLQENLGNRSFSSVNKTRIMVTTYMTDGDRAEDGALDFATQIAGDFLQSQASATAYRLSKNPDGTLYRRVDVGDSRHNSVALLKSWRSSGKGFSAAEAAYATSAAPTYFPALVKDGAAYFDGGVYAQNPADIALTEARKIVSDQGPYSGTSPWNDRVLLHSLSTRSAGGFAMDTKNKNDIASMYSEGLALANTYVPIMERDLKR